MRRIAALVCLLATPVAAQPGAVQAPPEALPAPPLTRTACDEHKFYLEPSLLIADDGDKGDIFTRLAGGARFHSCDPDGAGRIEGRLGATVYVSGMRGADVGLGLETELGIAPTRTDARIGLRLGYESATDGGRLYTLGMRYRPGQVSFGLDGFVVQGNGFGASNTGVMVGFGLEDKAGRYAAATEGVVAALLLFLVLAACAGAGNGC